MRRSRPLVVGSVVVIAAGAASAQSFAPGTFEATAVSGYSGRTERIGGDENGLYAIRWYEVGDQPCDVRIDYGSLEKRTEWLNGNNDNQYRDCPSSLSLPNPGMLVGDSGSGSVGFESNPRYYIRGLQVCTNDRDNHRLKGIKVWAAKVSKNDQRVEQLGATDSDQFNNCAVWHSPVYCPAGKVAFGLVVHAGDGGVTGLALRCKQVVW